MVTVVRAEDVFIELGFQILEGVLGEEIPTGVLAGRRENFP
jgi:hypothetical protein